MQIEFSWVLLRQYINAISFSLSETQESLAAGLGTLGGVMLLIGAAVLGVWVYLRCRRGAAAPEPIELQPMPRARTPPRRLPPGPSRAVSSSSEGGSTIQPDDTSDTVLDDTPTMTPMTSTPETSGDAKALSVLLKEGQSFIGLAPLPPKRTRRQRRDVP